jgi:hypothetical protein
MDGKRIVQQAFDAQRERDRHSTGPGLSIQQVTAIWNSVSIEGHSPGPVEGREIVRQALLAQPVPLLFPVAARHLAKPTGMPGGSELRAHDGNRVPIGYGCSSELDWLALYQGVTDPTQACGNGRWACTIGPPVDAPDFVEVGMTPVDACRQMCLDADEAGVVEEPDASDALLVVSSSLSAATVASALDSLLRSAWTLLRANRDLVRYILCLYDSFYTTVLGQQEPGGGYSGLDWGSAAESFLTVDTLTVEWTTASSYSGCLVAPMVGDSRSGVLSICADRSAIKFFYARVRRHFPGSLPGCSTGGDLDECLTIDFAAFLLHEVLHLLGWVGHEPENILGCIANTLRWALIQRYPNAGGCCDRFIYAVNSEPQGASVGYYTLWNASSCMWGLDPADYRLDSPTADEWSEMIDNIARSTSCCPRRVSGSGDVDLSDVHL